ncbi:U-box domain-containing protein 32 isoform X3 [Mangifera indica]|uniref:U-box domain-containing protein 32 isoform X3 n=1 Tax=Mangifera indica TaxID=29780 RepID=UPI001CF9C212|nr:U-box domain-containing protein 32 isoform X3 [Mangifera indica]
MESSDEIEREGVAWDVEETIFVAVGKNVDKSKTMLFWAAQSFLGKKICLLHVHKPAHGVALEESNYAVDELKQYSVQASRELERQKVLDILNQYLFILSQYEIHVDTLYIERDSVENGIVEVIEQYNIRWLVMGAAADKHYSKELAELKSRKAIFVSEQAPIFCHIWFACKGHLIYTRNRIQTEDSLKLEIVAPLQLLNWEVETKQSEHLDLHSLINMLSSPDSDEEADEFEETACCSIQSSWDTNSLFGTSKSTPLFTDEEEKSQGQATSVVSHSIEQAKMDAKKSNQIIYQEIVQQWKEEDEAVEAKCKVEALQSLSVKEMSQRKELEELLARQRQEVERIKNQHDKIVKELQIVQGQKSLLESQLAESHCVAKELEEKILSAVELLISFKQKRDELRIECGNAKRRVMELNKPVNIEAASFCMPGLLEFSFMEVNEATNNFDPAWKIGEGRYGSVYRGVLRHLHVAIKMLPSYGSQSSREFQNEVEVLSRVRHPNLVTLIGTCPESRSLVHEYLSNGSLEDWLTRKDKGAPLPWHTRIEVASEICSVLIYLHSNEPCIIHGNLKPSKILLDANFVSKLGDLCISHFIPRGEGIDSSNTLSNESNTNDTSAYMDPEYLETGKLTPESDVYSFGIILLRLLTGRPVSRILKDVKCALDNGNINALLDYSAGDWPLEEAKLLAHLALRCCDKNRLNRADLSSEIWIVLEPIRVSCVAPASCSSSKEPRRIPSHFMCPIFQLGICRNS